MFIEVTVLEALAEPILNKLQQKFLDFDVRFVKGDHLKPGKVGLKGANVLLGTEYSDAPYIYSWDQQMRPWLRDREVIQGKTPLIKALGLNRANKERGVVDATMGLGKDSCQLLSFGSKVYAYERVPEVFFMAYASQLFENFLEDRLILNFGSITKNIDNLPIYFDPMFDDGTKRKAKAHKGMSIFHQLIGADSDAHEEASRLRGMSDRLVIKRPTKKRALLENVNSSWEGKAISFDLYL